jgi:nickel/cobalt exporter
VNDTVLTTISVTGFCVAFFHAAIPNHWLPFVLTSRVQGWTHPRTIRITALAGACHVAVTALLGVGITLFGTGLVHRLGPHFDRLAGALLIGFSLYYLIRQARGKGHVHFGYPHEHLSDEPVEHSHHDHDHNHDQHHHTSSRATSDRATIMSLLLFLTLSPCEAFLPIYVSGIREGWAGFALLTAILSVGTVLGMVVFTSLSLTGLNRIRLGWLERCESGMMAALLFGVGLFVLLFSH